MKKVKCLKLVLILTLILTMMSSTFVFAAETSTADGATYGAAMGMVDGDIAGRLAVNANKVNNYLLSLPVDTEIVRRFALNWDNATYQAAFIKAYKDAFQTAYNTAYRTVNVDEYITPIENGYAHGTQAGTVQGQISAMIDFTQGESDQWESTYRKFLLDGSLTSRYFLERELVAYRDGFTSGYREAFMNSYVITFQTKNLETEIRNHNTKIISMKEETITFDEEYVHFLLGGMSSEMRTPMSLFIPAATIYEPTYISTFKTQNSFNAGNTKLTPVSSKYSVAVWNDSGRIALKKPVTLSFEYYGSERAGIYQWLNNKWVYQYTKLEEGMISTQIPAGYFTGGEYAIFIDDTYKTVSDITFNWAYKEIYTLMRRDVVSDYQSYYPNAKITKAQLALMIYNTMAAKSPLKTAVPVISDASSLGSYRTAVEYVVGKRFMMLDAKGAFNPGNSFSYTETEAMLSAMFLRDVKWTEVSNKMLTEKYTRSVGASIKTAGLTKAEAAYMLIVFLK